MTQTFTLNGVPYPLDPYTAPDGSVWHFTHPCPGGRTVPEALLNDDGDTVTLTEMLLGDAWRYLSKGAPA